MAAAPGVICSTACSSRAATTSGRPCDVAPPTPAAGLRLRLSARPLSRQRLQLVCSAIQEKEQDKGKVEESADPDAVARKFGLEAGLWKIFTSKEESGEENKGKKQNQAKELLARYGGAYLATSITLSLVSFGLCYVLVDGGVDVPSLLNRVGIQADATGEQVGTFALAYAAHKAASPIRFPPTVALTPIVAGWFKKADPQEQQQSRKD